MTEPEPEPEPESEPRKLDPGESGGGRDPHPPGAASAVVVATVSPAVGAHASENGASCVVIDVNSADGLPSREKESKEGAGGDWLEAVCRICHLSPELEEGGTELIQLGCACKGELAVAHQHCAAEWFRVKGNRCCEICGENAKNITGDDDYRFTEKWHERSHLDDMNMSERTSCCARQPFCHFVMACLVIAFILPWFFRISIF